jgi:hypothetical protein
MDGGEPMEVPMTLAERLQQPDVTDLSDWQAAALLNTPDTANGTMRVGVPASRARSLLKQRGEWVPLIHARSDSSLSAQTRHIVAEMLEALTPIQGEYDATIRMSDAGVYARVQTGMAALVSAGILTAATRAAVLALADAPRSWAEANGIEVTARTVGIARGAKA